MCPSGALSLHLVAFLDVLDGQIAISTRSVANDLAITEHFVVDHVEWERSLRSPRFLESSEPS